VIINHCHLMLMKQKIIICAIVKKLKIRPFVTDLTIKFKFKYSF